MIKKTMTHGISKCRSNLGRDTIELKLSPIDNKI
jgi:hypothetical protein